MKSTKEKVSYCIGLETGKNLKHQFADMEESLLLEGFQDGLSGASPKLSQEEIHSILLALRNQIQAQQKQHIAHVAQENKKQGDVFLAQNKEKDGIVVLPSGLQYKVIKSGSGPSPSLFDQVTIHYKGTFIDGRVFDSSIERGQPATFPLGKLIPGWSEALQLMKKGDKWQLFVPSYLAYGEHGYGPEIGPNTTLIFEVELIDISNQPA
ncbi:MAG: FKBP-type peptidyl-prolyl cis-trans isomerase [Chlamydiae bacterium]|nr:FKBP-type peptidyl-prolyl cis-trans isomerase [Chlamydiota bacterium]